ncbi:MAG: nucleoside-diphosphate sugar epimerase/dehydratase, partial [Pirellulaceae bacterium]
RRLLGWIKEYRIIALILVHTLLFAGTYYLSYLLRFEFVLPTSPTDQVSGFRNSIAIVVAIQLSVFYFLKNFHGWWRHVTFTDFVKLGRAATSSTVLILVVDYLLLPLQIPRTVIFINWLLTIIVIGSLRSVFRFWDENISVDRHNKNAQRVLLVGTEFDIIRTAHQINNNPQMGVQIVGLISEIPVRKIQWIGQLKIVGDIDNLDELVTHYRVKTVLAVSGSSNPKLIRRLMELSRTQSFQVRIIPKLDDHLVGRATISLREVSFEDLLRRSPVKLATQDIEGAVSGTVVMVTGAGGSIGSELCRQLSRFNPRTLLLLGRGENRLFEIERELSRIYPDTQIFSVLANVVDARRMNEVFETWKPDVVFHAAAHKHVPFTELNIGEAVINNVLGTQITADVAVAHGVKRFVLVSTDKAVNPTSVMGCTKQLAERYCLALGSHQTITKFVVTRFGNVLGSAGSVIPVFREQIQRGGPVTVTDPRMTRFFMTIPEAAQLVIQAGSMGRGGEVYVLDMGEPVKILDLAKDLIQLAGLPLDSIEIKFTGIRQGEKLYEELYYDDEKSMPTQHEKILSAYHRPYEYHETLASLNQLIAHGYSPPAEILKLLKVLVAEFNHFDMSSSEPAFAVEAAP